MSAERSAPSRRADASTLAIYLAAFTVPGLGSTLAWACARAWTGDRALGGHYRRALTIQLPCVLTMAAVQACVVAAMWWGPADLRRALLLAGIYVSVGLYLTMGLLGPVLLLAGRRISRHQPPLPPRGAPRPPGRRTPPQSAIPTRKLRPG